MRRSQNAFQIGSPEVILAEISFASKQGLLHYIPNNIARLIVMEKDVIQSIVEETKLYLGTKCEIDRFARCGRLNTVAQESRKSFIITVMTRHGVKTITMKKN